MSEEFDDPSSSSEYSIGKYIINETPSTLTLKLEPSQLIFSRKLRKNLLYSQVLVPVIIFLNTG